MDMKRSIGLAMAGAALMVLASAGAAFAEEIGGGPPGGQCHYNRQASLPENTCRSKLTEADTHCSADGGDSARYTACVDVMMKVAGYAGGYSWDDSSDGFICLPES